MAQLLTHTLSDNASRLTDAFVPTAGMIGVSLADGGVELLGQRRGLEAYRSAGKTMGIPLLHPWANRLGTREYTVAGEAITVAADAAGVHLDGNGLPMHGLLAAQSDWRVVSATENDLVAEFDFGAHPELLASFPFPHQLTLAVSLAWRRLTIRTTLTATPSKPVPLSFGFHPYL